MNKENYPKRSDRDGKHIVAAHIDGAAFKDFKSLGKECSKSTDLLVHEAIALLFMRHGKPIPPAIRKKLSTKGISIPGGFTPLGQNPQNKL